MAENNIAGFKKLMRYAQNLAEYEQGIAEGIIDENVFVIVLDEKVAKFRGQTFDWSGGISQSTADARYIRKTVDKFDIDLTFAVADGIVGTDDEYYFLPAKAPSTARESQILATKADINQGGGGGGTGGGGGSMDAESEEVIAAAFNDMNKRMDADKASFATKKALADEVAFLVQEIEQREEVTAAALADLDTRIRSDKNFLEQNYLTSEGFTEYMDNLIAEIQDNERVIAAALSDINTRLESLSNS